MSNLKIEIPCTNGQRISDILDVVTSVPFLIISSGLIYVIIFSFRYLRTSKLNEKKDTFPLYRKFLLRGMFVEYIVLLAKITVIPEYLFFEADPYVYLQDTLVIWFGTGLSSINLIPFKNILETFRYSIFFGIYQSVGNILLFFPFGVLAKAIFKNRTNRQIVMRGLLVSCGIELIQLFETRSVDVDDILLNVAGVFLGVFLFDGLKKKALKTYKIREVNDDSQ